LQLAIVSDNLDVLRLTLSSLHLLYQLCADPIRVFVFDNRSVFVDLIRISDLLYPVLALILVSMDFNPAFASLLVTENKVIKKLFPLSFTTFEPSLTYAIL
jgi:hypothetical protein